MCSPVGRQRELLLSTSGEPEDTSEESARTHCALNAEWLARLLSDVASLALHKPLTRSSRKDLILKNSPGDFRDLECPVASTVGPLLHGTEDRLSTSTTGGESLAAFAPCHSLGQTRALVELTPDGQVLLSPHKRTVALVVDQLVVGTSKLNNRYRPLGFASAATDTIYTIKIYRSHRRNDVGRLTGQLVRHASPI